MRRSRQKSRLHLPNGVNMNQSSISADLEDALLKTGELRNVIAFATSKAMAEEALNNEKFWAQRSHLPFQYFFERN
jgi:hypothetical protein